MIKPFDLLGLIGSSDGLHFDHLTLLSQLDREMTHLVQRDHLTYLDQLSYLTQLNHLGSFVLLGRFGISDLFGCFLMSRGKLLKGENRSIRKMSLMSLDVVAFCFS